MRTRRWWLLALAPLTLAACGDAGEDAGMEEGAEAGDVEPPSEVDPTAMERWNVRLDREGDPSGFQMVEEGQGWSISTGPAGITWRPADLVAEGDYAARATFVQRDAPPGHREAYGLLVGGRHLESPDQQYTYFLIRGTGDVLVKRRDGDQTSDLAGWQASEAVNSIRSEGEAVENTLEVRVAGDEVEFVVNGTVVETLPVSEVEPYGLAGLRVNHRLDLEVRGFQVSGAGGAAVRMGSDTTG